MFLSKKSNLLFQHLAFIFSIYGYWIIIRYMNKYIFFQTQELFSARIYIYMVLCSVVYVLYILQIRELRFSNVTVGWLGNVRI